MAVELAYESQLASELTAELAIALAAQLAAGLDHALMPQHAAGLALACGSDQSLEPKVASGLTEHWALCSCHGGLYVLRARIHCSSAEPTLVAIVSPCIPVRLEVALLVVLQCCVT